MNDFPGAGADRRLDVCILNAGAQSFAGGIGRAMAYLMQGWEASPNPPVIRYLDTRGSGSILLSPLFALRAAAEIVRLKLQGRVDVLHINVSYRGSVARKFIYVVLGRALGISSLIHLHGSQFDVFFRGLPRPGKALVRWMFRRASHVVVLGEYWRGFVTDTVGVSTENVSIICNGVPARPPRIAASASAARAEKAVPHILFLGRLGARKGVPELVKALAHPAMKNIAWRATLAGDGEVEAVRKEVEACGLADRVAIPGWLGPDQVEQALASADIYVLPSHHEGLPVSILEALARAIPVVATPVGAIPEFLTDGQSALILPAGDVDGLALALGRLASSAELRRAIGASGHQVFRNNFDLEIVSGKFLALYRAMLKRAA
jgi:glycosyltransferase involved in cell wall biosynthesis